MEHNGWLNGQCGLMSEGCCKKQRTKLNVYNYLVDVPAEQQNMNYVEVQFKNTRKGYYLTNENLRLTQGDWVVVESFPGYDIGMVTLIGSLVLLQMKKRLRKKEELKKICRIAEISDLEKFETFKGKEYHTMIQARKVVNYLKLQMKITDVEYQGDGSKAIFYYIAENRVDFRQLIKELAGIFSIRIEMKQIGARQEAGLIGGIGSCGRELCCAGWIANFVSVSLDAAQVQDISVNVQKLAGQCTKLRCCLNYETETYKEAQKKFPSKKIPLETQSDKFFCIKKNLLKNRMYYSVASECANHSISLSPERAFEIIKMNKKGQKPTKLSIEMNRFPLPGYRDLLLGENINRFNSKEVEGRRKGNKK